MFTNVRNFCGRYLFPIVLIAIAIYLAAFMTEWTYNNRHYLLSNQDTCVYPTAAEGAAARAVAAAKAEADEQIATLQAGLDASSNGQVNLVNDR